MGQKTGFKKGALLLSASLVLSTILGSMLHGQSRFRDRCGWHRRDYHYASELRSGESAGEQPGDSEA